MKGTWGRRVYGRIVKGEEYTLFTLEIRMETLHTCRIFVPNKELERYPGTYKTVLDAMVRSLEKEITQTQPRSNNGS